MSAHRIAGAFLLFVSVGLPLNTHADATKELCPILQAQLRADYTNTPDVLALQRWEEARTKNLKAMTTLTAVVQSLYADFAEDRPLIKAYLDDSYSNYEGILRNAQAKVSQDKRPNYFICAEGKKQFSDPSLGRYCSRFSRGDYNLSDLEPGLREFSIGRFSAPKYSSLQEVVERRSRLKAAHYNQWEIDQILGDFAGASTPAAYRKAALKNSAVQLTASEESGDSQARISLSLFDLVTATPPATPYELYDRNYPRPQVVSELDYINKNLPANCPRIKSLDSNSTSSPVTATGLSKPASGSTLTDQNSQAPRPSSVAAP